MVKGLLLILRKGKRKKNDLVKNCRKIPYDSDDDDDDEWSYGGAYLEGRRKQGGRMRLGSAEVRVCV